MAVGAATRFEASKTALNALIPESTGLTKIRLDELVEMMVERMRPTGGRTVTLGPGDVADLERAARQRGQDVEELFKGLLKDALAGMIDVDGQRLPVLLIDDIARDQLANFAGVSFNTDQTVRPSLAATADDGSRRGSERTASFLTNQDLLLKAQGGMARGSRREKPPSELGLIMQGVRNLAGDSSIAGETLEALGPRIEQSVSSIGLALWKDRAFRSSFSHVIKDPKLFCGQVGRSLSAALGCKMVNEQVLSKGAQLAASIGAKEGVKKSAMGLLSAIPLANVIPMLFTGAEMLGEFTKKEPNKATLCKGLATFALQLGAIAFPPLGLAAAAVDITGSVAIAVNEGQKSGLAKGDRKAQAEAAIESRDERSVDMATAIKSNSGLAAQALAAIESSFRDLGSHDRAETAKQLGERARAADPENATQLDRDIGKFAFDTLLPEIVAQVKRMKQRDPDNDTHWTRVAEAFEKIGFAAVARGDDQRNEPKLKALIESIVKVCASATAASGDPKLVENAA